MDSQEIDKIDHVIWLQTGFLGDLIINTWAIKLLKQKRPDIKQHFITTPIGAAALERHSNLDSIVIFDKKKKGLRAFPEVKNQLQQVIADNEKTILLQPHLSFRSSLLSWYLKYPAVAFEEAKFSFLAWKRLPRVMVFHEAVRIGLLLEAIGLDRKDILQPSLYLDPIDEFEVDKPALLTLKDETKDFIAIAPGSVWGTKRWLTKNYSNLVRLLLKKTSFDIVLLGSKDEAHHGREIVKDNENANNRIINLIGITNLKELRYVVPRMKGIVCNDSSLLHYASAFNIPSFPVFGATIPEMGFAPLSKVNHVSEVKGLKCRPCSDHGPKSCPLKHFKCMKGVSPIDVFETLINHLGSK